MTSKASTASTLLALLAACALPGGSGARGDVDWQVTGSDAANTRYSRLAQIDRSNVDRLEVAWIYRTGDATDRSQIQATPIIVDGVLYSTSPMMKVFALSADTGEEIWIIDPTAGEGQPGGANRGVVYWEDGDDRRILFTVNRRLYAVDAGSGQPIATFGDAGSVDLASGLGVAIDSRDADENPFGSQMLIATSPGVVYGDLLIQGSRVSEGAGALPGHVQAFDIRTGEVRWVFHTIPGPGEVGQETWPAGTTGRAGGANSWAGMAVDVKRGIVFVPTGSASPDFWGGGRVGANLFANSLIALDAATGERIWHFQTVHHDLWDRDLPAAPNLLTVMHEGRRVDAVAQITKQGFVFLFERETGEALFPIEERPVPPSTLPGEEAWPTQPFPVKPEPIARQTLTEADLTDLSPEAHAHALDRFRALRQPVTPFTPPSLQGSVLVPAFDGGGGWGGAAVDPDGGVLYVNASDVPGVVAMAPTDTASSRSAPREVQEVYADACAGCHGENLSGDGDRSPSLVDVKNRMSAAEIREVIDRGRGFMPAFASLPEPEKQAVTAYLLGTTAALDSAPVGDLSHGEPTATEAATPYRFLGYERWLTADGLPAIKPPWGSLTAIDMNSGEHLWRMPLGEHPAVSDPALQPTGTRQYGGPIVTAGGLLFIGATMDEKFRAIDRFTGEILWETQLPAAGYATPATYMVGGRQYVVIAAGGGKLGTAAGDAYVAFALPEEEEF